MNFPLVDLHPLGVSRLTVVEDRVSVCRLESGAVNLSIGHGDKTLAITTLTAEQANHLAALLSTQPQDAA